MSSTTSSSAPTDTTEVIGTPKKKVRLSPPHDTNPRKGTPPRRGFFSATPRRKVPAQQNATTGSSSYAVPTFSPPTNSLLSRLANNANANTAPNTPAYEAAKESVISQMVTSQDIEVPATVPKAKAKPKTGGRRGRGGRSTTTRVKAEPVDTPSGIDGIAPTTTPGSRRGKGTSRGRGGTRGNKGGRPRTRGGITRGGGTKRKRYQSDDEDLEKDDTDASENYVPLTATRSGRKLTQATSFQGATVIDLEAIGLDSPSDIKPPPPRSAGTSARKGPTKAKEKEKEKEKLNRRKPGEAAVCKNCGRGHSPLSNMIVFCDGCNTPWHQYCHNAPISQEVIQIAEAQWFCGDCEILRDEKKTWDGNISAERMTIAEKRRYLLTLPPENLVSILLQATTLHPGLPIFAAAKPPTAEAIQLVTQTPTQTLEQAAAEEELYDFFAERELLPYPKAGHGVAAKLPPESEDLHILLDEDSVTYSHSWGWTESDLFGDEARHSGGWFDGARMGVDVGA